MKARSIVVGILAIAIALAMSPVMSPLRAANISKADLTLVGRAIQGGLMVGGTRDGPPRVALSHEFPTLTGAEFKQRGIVRRPSAYWLLVFVVL